MEKPIKHVVSLSGGKDSTAMLLKMLEESKPVDIILFCDTGLEFEAMYRHIDKLENYIGKKIIWLKSPQNFEYLFFEHVPKRKNPELEGRKGYSWGDHRNRWCTAMLKTRIINRYLRELAKDYTLKQYIGIAADETRRIRELNYPWLIGEWRKRTVCAFAKNAGLIGRACMKYFIAYLAGAVRYNHWTSFANSKNTSLIFGKDCAIWMRTHGEHLKKLLRGETGNTLRL